MCTRTFFSENGKLAFRHRGTASHMCKTGQTRSFTPKNGFQVVLKAVVHLVAIVVKRGQGLGWNATITVYSLVYLLSSRIARCRSVVRTGSIVLGRQPLYLWLFFKIGYTTVSSSLYNVTSVHLNIWSSSPRLAVHLAHSIYSATCSSW